MNDNIAILGQSKTGTTAAWYAIKQGLDESNTEYFGFYEKYDPMVYRNLARMTDAPIVAKFIVSAPDFETRALDYFDVRVFLVREPRDTLVSYLLWTGNKAANMDITRSAVALFAEAVGTPRSAADALPVSELLALASDLVGMNLPLDHAVTGMSFADVPNTVELRYEDLVGGELEQLGSALGLDLVWTPPDDAKSHVLRSTSTGQWRSWFLPSDVDEIELITAEYRTRFGYPDAEGVELTMDADTAAASLYILDTYDFRTEQRSAVGKNNRNDPAWLRSATARASLGQPISAYRYASYLHNRQPESPLIHHFMTLAAAGGVERAIKFLSGHDDG